MEHEKTKRTLIPQLNSINDEVQIKSGKKRPPLAAVSKASGAIANLIQQTPENVKKTKKFAGKINEGNEIFSATGFQKLKKRKNNDSQYYLNSNDPLNIYPNEDKNRNNR